MNAKAGLAAAAAAAAAVPLAVLGIVLAGAGAGASPSLPAGGLVRGLNLSKMPAAGRQWADWYVKSAQQCPELSPALLAAQGYTESNFQPEIEGPPIPGMSERAVGIAQFLPSTYATWGADANGNGVNSPKDAPDAIMAQGKYMCSLVKRAKSSGISGDPVALALAGYNAGWGMVTKFGGVPPKKFAAGQTYDYVHDILDLAAKWSAGASLGGLGTGSGPDAVRRAATQMGVSYSWGGGTPQGPSLGFCGGGGYSRGVCVAATTVGWDCSSLTQYAWWPSLKLPRTAADQYQATASRPVGKADLQPGDLLFWSKGGPAGIYHVAIYAGGSQILQAPRTGRTVELVPLDQAMPASDYVGATRPGA